MNGTLKIVTSDGGSFRRHFKVVFESDSGERAILSIPKTPSEAEADLAAAKWAMDRGLAPFRHERQ